MKHEVRGQTARRAGPWICLVICLAVILGGCQKKEVPLSKAAQACRKVMLEEMSTLTTALTGPVANQDWGAVEPILQTFYDKLKKEGKLVPFRMGVMDRNGITQGMFPPKKSGPLDFGNYQPARIVFEQKKITQTILYLEGNKIFVLIAPLLQQDQITGAVAMVFPEEEFQKLHVSEQEFLSINFNQ